MRNDALTPDFNQATTIASLHVGAETATLSYPSAPHSITIGDPSCRCDLPDSFYSDLNRYSSFHAFNMDFFRRKGKGRSENITRPRDSGSRAATSLVVEEDVGLFPVEDIDLSSQDFDIE